MKNILKKILLLVSISSILFTPIITASSKQLDVYSICSEESLPGSDLYQDSNN